MKKLTFFVMALAIASSVPARAEDLSPYVSLRGVIADTTGSWDGDDDDYENMGINLAVGTKINENLRVEFEVAYRDKDTVHFPYNGISGSIYFEGQDNLSLTTTSYMMSGYYDFYNQSAFTPYVGFGVGMAKVEYENAWTENGYQYPAGTYLGSLNEKFKASKTKMVWNIALGGSYKINNKFNLDLGYRYIDYGSFTDSETKFKTKANEFSLGVRYAF